jgi:hypothetical protein
MSTNQAGKGDSPRPVNRAAWDATFERIEASKRAKDNPPSLETALGLPKGSFAETRRQMAEKEKTESPPDAATCSGWVGKLTHDRSGWSDWGWLRDEMNDLIIIVKAPPMDEEEVNKHRRAGTDPTQARVDAILAAINGQNAKCY